MPNLFLTLDLDFKLQDKEGNKLVSENYKSDADYNLSITVRSEKNTDLDIAFEIESKNSEGGTLTHQLKDSNLEISCQGIFKINVKESYVPDVLDKNALWLFGSFGNYEQGLTRLEVKDGLKEEKYEYLRQGKTETDIRYPLDVKTDKSKKNL